LQPVTAPFCPTSLEHPELTACHFSPRGFNDSTEFGVSAALQTKLKSMQLLCIPGFFTTPGSDELKNAGRQAFFFG